METGLCTAGTFVLRLCSAGSQLPFLVPALYPGLQSPGNTMDKLISAQA